MIAHIWQSTLFAGAAGLLTLLLKRNRARTRYWVWFIGLVKFLVPFGILVSLGNHLTMPQWTPKTPALARAMTQPAISFVMGDVTQLAFTPAPRGNATDPIPAILLGIWVCGFIGIATCWFRRWMRVRADVRQASKLPIDIGIPVVSSPVLCEPGVFGIFRPVLTLPDGMAGRLSKAEWEAILAHEICHVRCHDNLTAVIYMLIESVFWFHPLVWWMGTRLVAERERACDEEVLRLGSAPKTYVEGILKVCESYLESPLVCVSGVTGSNLKKRIEAIMYNSVAVRLNFARRAILAVAAIAALAAPIVVGIMKAPTAQAQSTAAVMPRFEAVSIKPTSQVGSDIQGNGSVRMLPGGRLIAETVLLRYFIQNAYAVHPFQIKGGPAWINSAHYGIDAKAGGNPNNSQMRLMMQALLEDRFNLKLHHETRDLPVYELTAAKSGVKLQGSKEGSCISPVPNGPPLFGQDGVPPPPPPPPPPGLPFPAAPGQSILCGRVVMGMSSSDARMQGGRVSMTDLIRTLSNVLGRTVVDKTGFTTTFDFYLQFTADESLAGLPAAPPSPNSPNNSIRQAPSPGLYGTIFAAIQEQLGLKLESAKGPVEVLIIDSVEKPSDN
jgi:bla regulator protein BlaR1